MAFIVNETNGDITLIQGDSGRYILNGLPTDEADYVICFQAQNENRVNIGEQISIPCNGASTITFTFTGDYTDAFTVKKGEETQEYFFAFKLCSESANTDETLLLGTKNIGEDNIMIVYPKIVEGI